MASYKVTIESGASFDVWGENAQGAMLKCEDECNRVHHMDDERAALLISESGGYWAKCEGGIRPAVHARAVSAELYRSDYVACGAFQYLTGQIEVRA